MSERERVAKAINAEILREIANGEFQDVGRMADAAIAAMNGPDEPEVPAVLVKMAEAIYQADKYDGDFVQVKDFLPEARAALRVVVRQLYGRLSKDHRAIADVLGMSKNEVDDLMAEGEEG